MPYFTPSNKKQNKMNIIKEFTRLKRENAILMQLMALQCELINSNTSQQYETTKQNINTLKERLKDVQH